MENKKFNKWFYISLVPATICVFLIFLSEFAFGVMFDSGFMFKDIVSEFYSINVALVGLTAIISLVCIAFAVISIVFAVQKKLSLIKALVSIVLNVAAFLFVAFMIGGKY